MQTLIVHSRRPNFFRRDLGLQRAVAATTLIGGAIIGGLFWPVFALGTIWRALTVGYGVLAPSREMSDVFTYILALSGVWAIVLPGGRRRQASAPQPDIESTLRSCRSTIFW